MVEADGYEVELKDLIPEQSIQLVIHRKKEPDIIAKVYHAEQDYQKPTEFSAASFEDFGVGATSSAYLPEEKVVHISFWKDELEDFDSRDYKIWLDKIELTLYNGID